MKRRLVIAFLIGFALWPAVHRGLVAAYDVNPWKLAGWAMYARPHFPSRVALYLVEGETERRLTELDEHPVDCTGRDRTRGLASRVCKVGARQRRVRIWLSRGHGGIKQAAGTHHR